jgi:hypothetical protein
MSRTREEVVNAILDKLFVNGMGQRADRIWQPLPDPPAIRRDDTPQEGEQPM